MLYIILLPGTGTGGLVEKNHAWFLRKTSGKDSLLINTFFCFQFAVTIQYDLPVNPAI